MHILVLSLRSPANRSVEGGGSTHVLYEVGRRWAAGGHRVTVLTTIEGSNVRPPRFESVDGMAIIRTGTLVTAPLAFGWWLRKFSPATDVVVENMHSYPLMGPLYVKAPYVSIVHGLVRRAYFMTSAFPAAAVGYFSERLLPFIYSRTHFASISELNKRDLVELGIPEDRIVLIPCGLDHEFLHPGVAARDPTILFLGVMRDRRKRVGDLIDAFRVVKQSIPTARLVLAGGGALERLYRAKAADMDSVTFTGYVSGIGKRQLLQEAWLFCMPSIRETFSIAAMEANACGVPVVAYATPGLETLRHGLNGLLVAPRDIRGLARALVWLLTNTKARQEMGSQALIHARQFSWDRMAQELLALFDFVSKKP